MKQHDVKLSSGKLFTQRFDDVKKINHYWLLTFQSILSLPFLIVKLYKDLRIKQGKNKLELAIDSKNIAMAITDAALSIIAVYIVKPFIFFVIALKTLCDNLLEMGLTIYQRFFVDKNQEKTIQALKNTLRQDIEENKTLPKKQLSRLAKYINSQHILNIRLVNHAHRIAIGLTILVGSVLTFTSAAPAAASLGATLLSTVGLYSFIDYLGLNPFRLFIKAFSAAQKSKPLAIVSEADVMRDLTQSVRHEPKTRVNPSSQLGIPQSSATKIYSKLMRSNKDNTKQNPPSCAHTHKCASDKQPEKRLNITPARPHKFNVNFSLPTLNHPRQATCSR